MAITTYTSPDVSSGVQPKGLRVGLVAVSAFWSTPAVRVTTGDVLQMVKVPQNAAVVGMLISTNANIGASVIVGDGVDTNRYHEGFNISASALCAGLNGIAYVPYVYSTDDTIDLTVSCSVTSSITSGQINLTVIYSMDV